MKPSYCRILLALAGLVLFADEPAAQHAGHHAPAVAEVEPERIPMGREASGTSWQPDAAPHDGHHDEWRGWSLMWHGAAQLAYTDQRGPRGDRDLYLNNMAMVRADRGAFGLRGMFSLEPATVGKRGYPLLLQTGETADGVSHLVDAQHPHDLFMELAATYEWTLSARDSAFVYFGLPGEPALGPPAFMHRLSGLEFVDSPIGHHWQDATHIAFGVLTGGWVRDDFKVELSSFTGREPDQHRYNIESPTFDSVSGRFSWNPTANWALQASAARIISPEQLDPDEDVTRYTASAMYSVDTAGGHWQVTGVWGRNVGGGHASDAYLVETAWRIRPRHTLLARAEHAHKDELVPGSHTPHDVARLSAGYVYELWQSGPRALGVGVVGTVNFVPTALEPEYGRRPTSLSAFLRLRF